MAIQIGKYKRPGIFIEEIDNSVFSTPVTEGITNLVIGVSKKGPVNTPIRLTSASDLEAVFGPLDRNLERSGSFFHRTISKMLETAPVYAMNLLLTDDELDKIEYKSVSASSFNENDNTETKGPYRRFFDTTGFWKRDSESFINLTKDNVGYADRVLGFTNMSDRNITVFIVKTKVSGFDRTLLEWYGSVEKMPPYVNSSDYASDYMVDVVIVGGDWSNYQTLSVDSRWSQYFNTDGLIKDQLRNFANDRNITLLSYYEGLSLIPYFRDLNGRNIFIETSVNRDTDTTGLFCTFNAELFEKDYYTGLVDLIGNTIVNKNVEKIDFLSYKENITETVEYISTPLDLPGNVTSIFGNLLGVTGSYLLSTDVVNTITGTISGTNSLVFTGGSGTGSNITLQINDGVADAPIVLASGTGYVHGDVLTATMSGTTSTATLILKDDHLVSTGTIDYNSQSSHAFGFGPLVEGTLVNADQRTGYFGEGTINGLKKANVLSTTASVTVEYDATTNPNNNKPFAIMGGRYVEFTPAQTYVINASSYEVSATLAKYTTVFVLNTLGVLTSYNGTKNGIAPATGISDIVLGYVTFDVTSGVISNVEMRDVTIDRSGYKDLVINQDLSVTSTGSTSFKVEFLGTTGYPNSTDYNQYRRHKMFNRLLDVIKSSFKDKMSILLDNEKKYSLENVTITDIVEGITFNKSFVLNNLPATEFTDILLGKIVLYTVDNELLLGNTELLTTNELSTPIIGVVAKYSKLYLDYFNGVVNTNDYLYDDVNDVKHYLRMFIDTNKDLSVRFMDELLIADEPINNIDDVQDFNIVSETSNLRQTIEIENVTNYVVVPNKILIDGSRYTELKVGDFLEADVNLEVGEEGKPRLLTRVLSKRQYVGDTNLSEVICDAAIKKVEFGTNDFQATRYVSIEQYAKTYKGITLKGFKIRQASLPDGTESRQNQVLNLVAKGTPLFKSLINKEAFDFRYLVDSFGLGLVERSKQQLVDICGERLDTFGFLNMPSIRAFKNSSSPSFVNREGVLQVEYIAQGGDPESNPAFLYTFGEGAGTTCVGYFTPYVVVNDNGRPLDFPPASYVATTYLRKHISNVSAITPWTIAAGVTNGKVTNIAGLELDFDPEDIEFLNQAQMNPIVLKKNRGYIIETENTAQVLYKSALSLIHVREVLIELERELSRMLLDYQWKFNTPDVRAEIKLRADVICETYVSKNGLFNYFNKMDDENNTSEIIDNQIGVLDTYVEPIKGMGIIVNNITILRTGAIDTGGFMNQ